MAESWGKNSVAYQGKYTNSDGEVKSVLKLTPKGKAKKYATELHEKREYRNDGVLKKDEKGKVVPLSEYKAAYNKGYLQAQRDSAGSYLSKQAKQGNQNAAKKIADYKQQQKAYWEAKKNGSK